MFFCCLILKMIELLPWKLQNLILTYLCESGLTLEQIPSTSDVGTHSNDEMLPFVVAECKYILKNGGGGCLF